jgi:O-antigen/teichoic acid export membrane protein
MTTSVSKNVGASVLNYLLRILGPLVLTPLYVRLLGHELYGEWLVIASLGSYIALADLGMGQALSNHIAGTYAHRRTGEIGTTISTVFLTEAAIATAVSLAIIVLTSLLSHRLLPRYGKEELSAFVAFVSLSVLALPFQTYVWVLRGFQRVDRHQMIEGAALVVRIVAITVALLLGFKILAVAVVNGAVILLVGLAACLCSHWSWPEARVQISFSVQSLRRVAKPSAGFLAMQVSTILNQGMDSVVIGYYLGGVAVTRYIVTLRMIMVAAALFAGAIQALTPTMTEDYSGQRIEAIGRSLILLTRVALLYAATAVVALWLAGPTLLAFWAGSNVFPGPVTFGLQLAYFFLLVLFAPAITLLTATTRHYGFARLLIVEGIINLILSVWWVQRWGLPGVMAGTLAASVLTNTWYVPLAAVKTIQLRLADTTAKILPEAAAAFAAMALAGILWAGEGQTRGASALGAALLAAILVAAALAWSGFTREERRAALAWFIASARGVFAKIVPGSGGDG